MVFKYFPSVSSTSLFWIRDRVAEIYEKRKKSKLFRHDYLQLLIDAQSDSTTKDLDEYDVHNLANISLSKTLTSDVGYLKKIF